MSPNLFKRASRRWIDPDERMSRRAVLAAGVASATALLASGCAAKARTSRRDGPRVMVVGAGLAGLACAYELDRGGADVLVLESRGRVGGRVVTLRDLIPGAVVEGGGEFIGSNHPLWLAYARRFGLELSDVSADDENPAPFFLDGRLLSAVEIESIEHEAARVEEALTEQADRVDPIEPWNTADARALDERSTRSFLESLDLAPLSLRAIELAFTADNGMPTSRQSLLATLAVIRGHGGSSYWTDTENHRCRGGNQRLAAAFAAALADRVRLNATVTNVDSTQARPRVRLRSGEEIECDRVVLAAPPSTWNRITLAPALPADLSVQMGRTVKWLSPVKSRYWRDLGLSQYATADLDVQLTWDGTDAQESERACLSAFMSDEAADRACAIPPADREAILGAQIEKLYPGHQGQLQAKPRLVDWVGDANTRAGYSFAAPGQVTRSGPILLNGIGAIAFAGEHCSYDYAGYMEGALQSGMRVARSILAS